MGLKRRYTQHRSYACYHSVICYFTTPDLKENIPYCESRLTLPTTFRSLNQTLGPRAISLVTADGRLICYRGMHRHVRVSRHTYLP